MDIKNLTSRNFFRCLESDYSELNINVKIPSDIKFAIKMGLQPVDAKCDKCNGVRKISYRKGTNSVYFRCHKCNLNSSAFDGTFKGKFGKVSWGTIFAFIWHLICIDSSLKSSCLAVAVSCTTGVDWANFIRHAMMVSLINLTSLKIGGPGKTVEIDDTVVSKQKCKKGRKVKETKWVVGGICREDKNCFLCFVNDRSETTLNWVVSKFVQTGSTIYTDKWKGYNHIDDLEGIQIKHETVKHAKNFVNPLNGVHTQSIKRLWGLLKNQKNLPTHYTEELCDSYLYAFMYKKFLKWGSLKPGERFEIFCQHLSKIYPGAGRVPEWKEPETVSAVPGVIPKRASGVKRQKEEPAVPEVIPKRASGVKRQKEEKCCRSVKKQLLMKKDNTEVCECNTLSKQHAKVDE
ncbi:uncharacterized protein LOC111623810 [Centruroides sculpturatus]|uniref:uncharacterized protein LOC111623810 n=1 Tax=Centruroides sculpturatus TaxID=218467 RepID=UPI000C6D740A|nr:uncharacterized protein LOC111623810 [Centruroides sculpturatus]XP_023222283.1 uncharacterized protein LOC111623810 [Centruroides sculpturatus]XP_023222284.1 uncharacterized protein LOC111623810 [Centruroides sculpturatus]XP_023222285.1 uncharacterized protein LOC111623810 [Centruroides sculpturatus]